MEYLVNFAAFCFPVLLFCYWGIVGYAALSLLRSQRNILQNILLAPAIGLSVTLLPVFWLNHAGLPIISFATTLCIFLFAISIAVLIWRKPLFPIKRYLPFAGIFFLALFLTGRPLLKFGFDWISYANDDMANYCLMAMRMLNHGFYDIPNINDLLDGKDYSQFYWFMHVAAMTRAGVDTLLAWVSAVTHLTPLQTFMPVILTFHIALISTVGSLIYKCRQNYYSALTTSLLLSFSALTNFGTLYQLFAQVAGLCLLTASVILIFHKFSSNKNLYGISQGVLIGIIISALLITYPEVAPFLGISFILYFTINYYKGWRLNRFFCLSFFIAILFSIILINRNLINVIFFLLYQSKIALLNAETIAGEIALFPFYLLPSGFANLWGLQAISQYSTEPILSLAIFIGMFLFIFGIIGSIRQILLYNSPQAIMTLVMVFLGISLFKKYSGFGLYKLAMYIQPFILSIIVITLFEFIKNNKLKFVLISIFIFINFLNLNYYVIRSEGLAAGSFTEIAFGSHTKIKDEYLKLISSTPKNSTLISDDYNVSLIKFLAAQSLNHNFHYLIAPLMFGPPKNPLNLLNIENKALKNFLIRSISSNRADEISSQYHTNINLMRFDFFDPENHVTDFFELNSCIDDRSCEKNIFFILDTGLRTVINRRKSSESIKNNFDLKKFHEIENHIAFIDSTLGNIYYYSHSEGSFYNLEKDLFYPNETMQAVGEFLLFRVFNPIPKSRFSLSLTNTLSADGINKLPSADVIGNKRIKFPLIGRGSARIFSDPISPQKINNNGYIGIDMNNSGSFFQPSKRQGLMLLYNRNISIDPRRIVSFTRDISLITEDEYQKLNLYAPTEIKKFPDDLANINLEYSGIYEDGWISEDSFFMFKHAVTAKHLVLKGMLPIIDENFDGTTLSILIDNKKIIEQKIKPGDFTIDIPVSIKKTARRKVELHFDKTQHLPNGDNRIIAVLVDSIGFE